MPRKPDRLTRTDWILAGFRALAQGGVAALRVEPVARMIGTTKGSFYWHFTDPADWQGAMLDHWSHAAFARIVAELDQIPPGLTRLVVLADTASRGNQDPTHGGAAAEPALRDWARYDATVSAVVAQVDAGRVRFVQDCLESAGVPATLAKTRARIFYAAYLGLPLVTPSGSTAAQDLTALAILLATPPPQSQQTGSP